jgi:hypothetical protein
MATARNGNLELPVYFLKAKERYTVRQTEEEKWIYYILINYFMCIPDFYVD